MTISKIIFGGFKSFKEPVEIPLAPITFLFGPNSVGKSVVRDALVELQKRLARPKVKDGFGAALIRFASTDSNGHQLPREDEFEEPKVLRTILGCEIDQFDAISAAQNIDGIGDKYLDVASGLYWAMDGKTVKYWFCDEPGEWTCAYELRVDGKMVLQHMSADTDEHASWPDLSGFDENTSIKPSHLGLLRLNLSHEVLAEPEFQALVKQIIENSTNRNSAWDRSVMWVSDAILNVRLSADKRVLKTWSESLSEGNFWPPLPRSKYESLPGELSALCAVVNELARMLEWTLEQNLVIALVTGSRTTLSEKDASSGWFEIQKYSSFRSQGYGVDEYARWLGIKSVDPDDLKLVLDKDGDDKDDYVNDVLTKQLFSARKYTVKAEVSLREDRLVLPRDGLLSTDSNFFMKSDLYLLDEQFRTLSFDQVGSGVSYLMPVLTALWGAEWSLIEQPELHLHPAAQCEVGDAVIRAFNRGRFSIIETHSEHLLLRVLRRIRQTSDGKVVDRELQCQPEAVAVLYFSAKPDGTTQIDQLRVTRGGDFMDRWPDGFFEERSRELFDE